MNKDLLQEIRTNKEVFEAKILNLVKENNYQYERNGVKYSLALGAITNTKIKMNSFASMLGKTDLMISLNEHLACVVFSSVDTEQGLKAASKLLNEFEAMHFSNDIFLSIINISDCSSQEKQLRKLFNVVEFAISNGINNIPLDEISLEGL